MFEQVADNTSGQARKSLVGNSKSAIQLLQTAEVETCKASTVSEVKAMIHW